MLQPLSFDIQKQESEIEAAQVIPGQKMAEDKAYFFSFKGAIKLIYKKHEMLGNVVSAVYKYL